MFRRVAVGTALALALLAAFGLGWFLRGESAPSAPPAPTAVLDRFEGALLPVERRFVFAPLEARVVRFEVEPGSTVGDRQRVVLVYCPELEKRILQFRAEVDRLTEQIKALELEAQAAGLAEVDRRRILAELHRARAEREVDVKLGDGFIDGFDADEKNPGYFWLKSPPFQAEFADKGLQWTVLDQDSRKDLIDRTVRPSEPLLRLGARNGP